MKMAASRCWKCERKCGGLLRVPLTYSSLETRYLSLLAARAFQERGVIGEGESAGNRKEKGSDSYRSSISDNLRVRSRRRPLPLRARRQCRGEWETVVPLDWLGSAHGLSSIYERACLGGHCGNRSRSSYVTNNGLARCLPRFSKYLRCYLFFFVSSLTCSLHFLASSSPSRTTYVIE